MNSKKVRLSLVVILLVVLAIGGVILYRQQFAAFSPPGSPSPVTAKVEVLVKQNGTFASGSLQMTGDCPLATVPRNNNLYSCTLRSGAGVLKLSSITFNGINGITYSLPINPTGFNGNQYPFLIPANSVIALQAEIDSNGNMILKQAIDGQLTDVTSTGLQGLSRQGYR